MDRQDRRISRRTFLGSVGAASALAALGPVVPAWSNSDSTAAGQGFGRGKEYSGIPLRVKAVITPDEIGSGNILDAQGNYVYIANRGPVRNEELDPLAVIDVSDPGDPKVVGTASWTGAQAASSVCVKGRFAYVTDPNSNQLAIIDVSEPSNPAELGVVTSNSGLPGAWHVDVRGNYAYIVSRGEYAGGGDAFTSIDVRNPENPEIVSVFKSDDASEYRYFDFHSHYAFVCEESRGIEDDTGRLDEGSIDVFDIKDPTNLTRVARLETPEVGNSRKIAIQGTTGIVCGRNNDNVVSVDVSDPTNPRQLDSFASSDIQRTHGVDISGRYAYIASEDSDTVTAFDISNPRDLQLAAIASDPELETASGLVVQKGTSSSSEKGFRVSLSSGSCGVSPVSN